jgi:hypothetical protein
MCAKRVLEQSSTGSAIDFPELMSVVWICLTSLKLSHAAGGRTCRAADGLSSSRAAAESTHAVSAACVVAFSSASSIGSAIAWYCSGLAFIERDGCAAWQAGWVWFCAGVVNCGSAGRVEASEERKRSRWDRFCIVGVIGQSLSAGLQASGGEVMYEAAELEPMCAGCEVGIRTEGSYCWIGSVFEWWKEVEKAWCDGDGDAHWCSNRAETGAGQERPLAISDCVIG